MTPSRPIRVEINLSALKHNYAVCKKQANHSDVYAVLKANAYGHGIKTVAETLADEADGLALLNIEEAVALRLAGFTLPILLLEGPFTADDIPMMAEYALAGVIHSKHQLEWLAQYSALPAPFIAWLKVDSGMNRLGFDPQDAAAALAKLRSLPTVKLTTIMTHFACAENETMGIEQQWQCFAPIAQQSGLKISAANAAALFSYPQTHGDCVRPGLTLYGCSPFEKFTGRDLGLIPAMTLSADIIAIRHLKVGDCVGYGAFFTASAPKRIGIVACGYADGYPRTVPNGTPVSIAGVRSGTVGRVSMDMLAVDITQLPQVGIGHRVILWGEDIPLEHIATSVNTLAYELMCAISPRVPVVTVEEE